MAFLGTEKLKKLIENKKVVVDADPSRIVCGAYELSLGEEVFVTDSKERKKQFLKHKEQITINPGQFALLLTQEEVRIPNDKIAFISIKAGIKLKGLVNVSGFHVDPGFNGKLVFSVYNAGSSPISLIGGEACFLIWFSDLELTDDEITSYSTGNHEHKNQNSIPVKYIDALIAGELASPNVLLEKINSNHTAVNGRINTLSEELRGRINAVDRESQAKKYLAGTALGLVIAVVLKFIFDWVALDIGFNKAIEINNQEIKFVKEKMGLDSVVYIRFLEKKKLLYEIDSLEHRKKQLQPPSKP